MKIAEINDKTPELIERLTDVWERSVKATHLFFSASEIDEIKKCVPQAILEIPHLVIAANQDGSPVGFMGVDEGKLQMLFI